jgi:hypothetical protein
MTKTVAFLTIHGMGETEPSYAKDIERAIQKKLASKWNKVEFDAIYYQHFLQPNELDYYEKTKKRISWGQLRKLMINGFADAGSLEYSRATPGGPYYRTQNEIMDVLGRVFDAAGPVPVVILAQSLGCEVISNYIWDANKPSKTYGFWKHAEDNEPAGPRLEFQKLKTLHVLMTTGCNIPVFITGLAPEERVPINRPNPDFIWENYYDKDDVLGYPLADLSDAYAELVIDHRIPVGNLFTGWNPFSHNEYWDSRRIQGDLTNHLKRLM